MAAEVCAGTSSTSDKERMEASVTAMNMIANGRRNVVCGEIPTAVNQFQEACKLLAKAYGETAKECAEAYFYYGQALLDLARMETGVLGNALQGVPDTDEDEENKSSDDQFEKGDSLPADERERLRDEIYEAMAEPEEVKKDVKATSQETVEIAMDFDESKPETLPEIGKEECEEQDDEKGEIEKEDHDYEKNGTSQKQEVTVDVNMVDDDDTEDSKKEDSELTTDNGEKIEEMEDGGKVIEIKSDEEREQSTDKKSEDMEDEKETERSDEEKKLSSDKKNEDMEDEKVSERKSDEEKEQSSDKKSEDMEDDKESERKSDEREHSCNKASEDMEDEKESERKLDEEKEQSSDKKSEVLEDDKESERESVEREHSCNKASEDMEDEINSDRKLDEEREHSVEKDTPDTLKLDQEKDTNMTGLDKHASKSLEGEKEQIKADEEEQVEDMDEPLCTQANGEEKTKESNEGSDSAEKENGTEEEEEEGEETLDEGETSQDEKEPKEGEESPDDISNLQLAWEMLELAKVIYLKEDTRESKIKAAEAHLKLGEVSLETEQYEQAVEDFNQCLKIQKEYMEPEDRALAETYYQLGLAFGFNKQYDEAIESYKTAIRTIENKIAKLTKFIDEKSSEKGKEPVDFDDPVSQAIQEVKDLNDILPDIHTKIEDTEEEKRQVDELKAAAKEVIGFSSSSVPIGQTMETCSITKSDVKVTDISHLIKRKRKPEEEEAGEEVKELKKTRQEDGEGVKDLKSRQEDGSGDATTKETENGHALDKDQPQDVPMEEVNPAEITAS